jgi:hypothetical protein
MVWALVLLLLVVWLLGVIASIGGALIHILLAVALVALVAGWLRRNRIPG